MHLRNKSLLLLLLLLTSSCYSTRSYTFLRTEGALLPSDSKVTSVLTTGGRWVPFDRLGGTFTRSQNSGDGSARDVSGIQEDGSMLRIPYDSIVAIKVSQEAVNSHGTAAVVIASLAAGTMVIVALILASFTGGC